MTILFICNEYPPHLSGGIGIFVKSMAEELVKRKHVCLVAGLYPISENSEEEIEGVKVFRFGMKKRKFILPAMNRWYEVRRKKKLSETISMIENNYHPDIIESFEWSGPLYKRPNSKLLIRLHGSHSAHALAENRSENPFLFYWEKRNYNMADACVAVSHHIKTTTEKCFGKQEHISVVHNPLNPLFQLPYSPVERNEYRILFVGKYHERKGVQELAQILNELLPLNSQYEFVFAGHHTEEQREIFLRWITPMNHSRIVFHHAMPQQQLKALYLGSSLMLMPTRAEAFGLTAIEAMACGCLVAMNHVASAQEIIINDETGLLIDINDIHPTVQRIHALLSSNRKDLIRKSAREKVLNDFGMDLILDKNMVIYKHLIEA